MGGTSTVSMMRPLSTITGPLMIFAPLTVSVPPSRLMTKGIPFIVPVSVDGTTERGALVPDAFLAVQWTGSRERVRF